MDFGKLLSRTNQILLSNKFLFVLGFLAALGGGASFNYSSGNSSGGSAEDFSGMSEFWSEYAPLIIIGVILIMLLGIAFWLLSLVGQGGLIDSVNRIENGETVSLGSGFQAGMGHLLGLVGLQITMYLPLWVPAFLMGLLGAMMAFFAIDGGEDVVAGLGIVMACSAIFFLCLGLPFLFVVTILYPFAQRGVVIGKMGIVEAIRHSWAVVRDNISDVILLVLLYGIITVIYGILTFILLLPFGLIMLAMVVVPVMASGDMGFFTVVLGIIGLITLGFFGAVINSLWVTYRSTATTLAYNEFMGRVPLSEKDPFAPKMV
ncbi:MAG TPA: hypothetical protein VLL52_01540 [Anaerolineae bacterium]|nr:hypothetical protein [Anaerolineae bacterium]